jgi:RNA polymerase sigma-70 factor, ECF subfamily
MDALMRPPPEMIEQVQPMIPALRRYARGLLRDAEDADDLVQDVLERVLGRWHLRQPGSLRSWVFSILHNLAIDRLRQRARRGGTAPLEAVPEDHLAIPATQEGHVEQQDILSLVQRMPEEHRSVLLLIGVEELSYAEAAAVLGIAQGTVMSRLSRARERLRRMVEQGTVADGRPSLRIVS